MRFKSRMEPPGFTLKDCESALDYLFIEELSDGGNDRLDFLAPEARSTRQKKKVQRTPRKYTFGKPLKGGAPLSNQFS